MPRSTQGEFNKAGYARPSSTHMSPQQAITSLTVRLPILERALESGFTTKAQEEVDKMYPALLRLALMAEPRLKNRLIAALHESSDGAGMVEASENDTIIIDGIFHVKELGKRFAW